MLILCLTIYLYLKIRNSYSNWKIRKKKYSDLNRFNDIPIYREGETELKFYFFLIMDPIDSIS
jgi:hypothetical protein